MGEFWVIIQCSVVFLFLSCSSGSEVSTVDVHETRDLLNQGHRYLDVRTEEEFKNGHVENALNIPYMFNTQEGRVKNPNFMDQVLSICGKEDRLVVGCQSGVRSVYAIKDLLDAEFKHVYNMGGGYIAWVGKGFEVKKPGLAVEKPQPVEVEKPASLVIEKRHDPVEVEKHGCAVKKPQTLEFENPHHVKVEL